MEKNGSELMRRLWIAPCFFCKSLTIGWILITAKSFISMLLNLHSKIFKLRMVEMVMNFICSISVILVLGGMT